jgi:apolipoprotein N-acyltransferase
VKNRLSILAALVSGALLFLAFPPFESGFCGWVGLIPLIIACNNAAPRRAALLGWLTGTVFFAASLYWLRHVTWPGTLGLALYCAVYFIPFAVFVSLRQGGWGRLCSIENLIWIAGGAVIWAASEYLRAILFTGFGWNLLGVSQYRQLPLIQIAEWGGVYAVSALMVVVNLSTATTLLQYIAGVRGRTYRVHSELLLAFLLLAAVWSFGLHTLITRPAPRGEPVHVALIQPNIPEVGNWELADPELIYSRLETLTGLVQHAPDIDLIIWPETALPDFVRYSARSAALVKKLTSSGTPLLAGSMDVVWHSDAPPDYYNASMLFNGRGELLDTYYKQHLVLFGEYIPFEGKIPLINALTPIGSSFRPGLSSTIFYLPEDSRGFGVLICFEDTLPYLARNAARAGASWLVNQTNDSWFDPDCGSQQHLANAVFRSVETRLPMLRCTNTGITCAIDPFGRITQTLAARTEGFQIVESVPQTAEEPTFYVRFGDGFARACLLVSVAVYLFLVFKNRKISHA